MKILHIIEIRGIGGAEKLLLEFLAEQRITGLEVSCILMCNDYHLEISNTFFQFLRNSNISVLIIRFKYKYSFFSIIKKIYCGIKSFEPDIIHTHLRMAEFYLACFKVFKNNLKIVTTVHGYSDQFQSDYSSGKITNVKLTLRYYVIKFINSRIDGLAFISNFIYKFYFDAGLISAKSAVRQINNGALLSTNTVKNDLGKKKLNYKVILPGRLIEWKGHKYAFEAVKILKGKFPNVKLDCFGTGTYENELSKFINDNNLQDQISLNGFTNNIVEVIHNYDVVLVPSLFESFGIVFLDAFAAGIPVVAFDLPAGNEIITHKKNGMLSAPKSAKSIADNVEKLFLDSALRRDIVLNAANALVTKYSITQMVDAYIELYKDVLSNSVMLQHK